MSTTFSRGIVCCDIDSTLARTYHRRHLSPTVDPDSTWERYAEACGDDEPDPGVVTALRLFQAAGCEIHLVSNRPVTVWRITEAWVARHHVPYTRIKLRTKPLGDGEDVKLDHIAELRRRGDNPLLFIEDWPATAGQIEAAGVPVLCVNPRYEQLAPIA